MLISLPLLEPDNGFWQRAGVLRARVLKRRRRARLGDALIAQSCLDREIALLTRDHDFQAFADAAEVRLTVDTDNVSPILFPPPLPPPPDDPLL
jgi:predicted nucleic acid-binding protein